MPPKLITVEWEEEEVFIRPPAPPIKLCLATGDNTTWFDVNFTNDFRWLRVSHPTGLWCILEVMEAFLESN